MSVNVKIPPRYVRTAKRIARERNQSSNRNKDSDDWGVDPEYRNFIGALGELAFALYADLQINSGVYLGGDKGYDFRARIHGDDVTVDIKTRQSEPHALWVKEDEVSADYYVLGYLREPEQQSDYREVELLGGAPRDQLLNARKIRSDHGHENYSILIEDLDPIPDPSAIEPC